jgi:predicted metal-dependent hydrolase
MPQLVVGHRVIPYVVRRSARAAQRRIVVTPGQVEVIAPAGHTDEEIASYVHSRRRWVHDETERMAERMPLQDPLPSRWVTGAKVLYRGRRLHIDVERFDGSGIEIEHRGRLHLRVPTILDNEVASRSAEAAFENWAKGRIRADVQEMVRRFGPRLGVQAKAIRIKAQKHLWGSCGRDGTISMNWHLIFAPKPVLEYAVVHEICHLRDRSHGPEFWRLVASCLPDFEARKAWLSANELECSPTR